MANNNHYTYVRFGILAALEYHSILYRQAYLARRPVSHMLPVLNYLANQYNIMEGYTE